MSIANILYNLTIYPFEFVIEIIYFLFRRNDTGVAIIMIGVVVNIISIPIYNVADKWQKKELDLQKKFKPKIDEIKAVFSGDKRQMLIQTFYRINNYHPMYSLRGLFGLLIQIPIFIAAYHFISNLSAIDGRSFGIIKDLSMPDGLVKIGRGGGMAINILPILMTSLNVLSSLIHTRELSKRQTSVPCFAQLTSCELSSKERVPLFAMAGLFLVLLYNSPSALLVYWTTSNLFSLIKNIVILFLDKIKKIWRYAVIVFLSALALLFILVNARLLYMKPDAIIIINSIFFISLFILIVELFPYEKVFGSADNKEKSIMLFISAALLFILMGLFIPTSLIASSPEEFNNAKNLIAITFTRMFSLLFIYPIIAYFIFDKNTKNKIVFIFVFFSVYALFNTFLFRGSYGSLNSDLLFDSPTSLIPTLKDNVFNILTGFLLAFVIAILIINRKTSIIKTAMIISSLALVIISSKDLYAISQKKEIPSTLDSHKEKIEKEKIINMSRDGKNVFVIFMDRGISYYLPIIFENTPSIENDLAGFVWYKNAISPSTGTIAGLFSLLGGYDYTPLQVMKNDTESLRSKYNKATLTIPEALQSNGYITTLVYPPLAGFNWGSDVSVFSSYPYIKAYEKSFNIDNYIKDYVDVDNNYTDIYLMRFSLFRGLPMATRYPIYSGGRWASPYNRANLNQGFKEYQYIHELTNVINIISNTNTYTFVGNEMTHEPFYFNSDYKPSIDLIDADKKDLEKYGDNFMAKQLYANTAMLIELTNFVRYLKDNEMFDNTKIILISDHGGYIPEKSIFGFEKEAFTRSIGELNCFSALLMVKDFGAKKQFTINPNYITTADMPYLATEHTATPIKHNNIKESRELGVYGVIIPGRMSEQNKNTYNLNAMFNIKSNAFDTNNWQEIPKEKWQEIIDNE